MPGRHKNRDDYSRLFARIESSFNPEEMTDDALKEYLNASTPGMNSLAEQLSQVSIISNLIDDALTLGDLRELKDEIRGLDVHRDALNMKIQERIIDISVTIGAELAEEKGIKFTERTTSNVENWKGKEVLVIRENGKFKSWKRL